MTPRQHVLQGWIPVRRGDGGVDVVADVRPTPHDLARIARDLGVTRWRLRVVPVSRGELDETIARECRATLLHDIGESLATEQPTRSARTGLTRAQTLVPLGSLLAALVLLVLHPRLALIVLFAGSALTLGVMMSFRLLGVLVGLGKRAASGRRTPDDPTTRIPDGDLPTYTILVPVFREANIVARLIDNLARLDYPADRLEVLVLLEEDDTDTIAAARAARAPDHLRIVVVPRGAPQTKPRACNYGLVFARGDYLVIYDAEDRPEPDQLRRVVADFRAAASGKDADRAPLAVVQCALSYFNASYNVLTRLFAIEYSFLFDAFLPGIDGTGLPIPLGGTSNHFDTTLLRRIGGWDPYNVTEDADLGLRAAALGYRVGVNTSTTWEEACSRSGSFVKQRTRWIKGYLITSAVNLRHPVDFTRAAGVRGLVCLLALVLGTPAAFLVYPLMVLATATTLTLGSWGDLGVPEWVTQLGLATTFASTGLTIVLSAVVALPRYGWRIAGFAVLSPVYWLLHAVAAWRAAWQTVLTPHVWEKTPHGLSDDFEPEALLG